MTAATTLVLCARLALGAAPPAEDPAAAPMSPSTASSSSRTEKPATLAAAPVEERDLIERLRHSRSWVRRAFAAERLARFDCDASRDYLLVLLEDDSWRVRSFALLSLARRHVPLPETALAKEPEQRVIRTALRCRYEVPRRPLIDLVQRLARSERLDDKLMALELALAGRLVDERGKPEAGLDIDPVETLGQVILRMDRVETGSLSPRLAAITAGSDSGRNYKWREWLRKHKRDPGLRGAFVVPEGEAVRDRGPVAGLPLQRMVDLERHMQDLSTRPLDLAIALDCTASMSGEIAECQAGIDSLVLFAQDVAKSARIGIVGYRDEKDDWETKAWDLTASLDEAREHLWQLSADGGGDRPESVCPALRIAYGKMRWDPDALKSVILVGDAPPKPGTGDLCVELAKRAYGTERPPPESPALERGIRTYTIAPRAIVEESEVQPPPPAPDPRFDRPGIAPMTARKPLSPWRQKLEKGQVEYWKEIAAAGGGRSVGLARDASLMAEIAGLTLGDTFEEEFESFFRSWLALCR